VIRHFCCATTKTFYLSRSRPPAGAETGYPTCSGYLIPFLRPVTEAGALRRRWLGGHTNEGEPDMR